MSGNRRLIVVALFSLAVALSGCEEQRHMLIGVHVQDCSYMFSEKGALIESIDLLQELGSEGIGMYMGPDYAEYYPEVADSGASSLVELAETEPFKAVLDAPFAVYSITCYAFANGIERTRSEGPLSLDSEAAYREMREFSEYLLREYGNTGKTFILKNWEADWHLLGTFDIAKDPTEEDIAATQKWLQARIDAVKDTRNSAQNSPTMRIYSAVEFNHVLVARNGRPRVINRIIPHLDADLYSLSSWDTIFRPHIVIELLDYAAGLAPDSEPFGDKNIMIGEWGSPDNHKSKVMMEHLTLEAARSWGVPYSFYWQLYDNECNMKVLDPTQVERRREMFCRGFSLIDRFGVKKPSWYLLKRFIESNSSSTHRYEDMYADN